MSWKTGHDDRMDHLMSGRRVFDTTGRASKLSKTVLMFLMELFPHLIVYNEYFCWYKGSKLFFDFHIREYKLYLNVKAASIMNTQHTFIMTKKVLKNLRKGTILRESTVRRMDLHLLKLDMMRNWKLLTTFLKK